MDTDFAHWGKCSKNRDALPGSVETIQEKDKDVFLCEKQFPPKRRKADGGKRCERHAEQQQIQGKQKESRKERAVGVQIGLVLQDGIQRIASVESPEEAKDTGQERAEGRIDDGMKAREDGHEEQEENGWNREEVRGQQAQESGFRDADGAGLIGDFEMRDLRSGEETEKGVRQFVDPDIDSGRNAKSEKEDGKKNCADDERADGGGKGENGGGPRREIFGDDEKKAEKTGIDGDENEPQKKQTPEQNPGRSRAFFGRWFFHSIFLLTEPRLYTILLSL